MHQQSVGSFSQKRDLLDEDVLDGAARQSATEQAQRVDARAHFGELLLFLASVTREFLGLVLNTTNNAFVDYRQDFLIFGESLFNDGITVVIFDTLEKLAFIDSHIPASTFGFAILSFIPVAVGGFLVGVIYGLVTSFLTK